MEKEKQEKQEKQAPPSIYSAMSKIQKRLVVSKTERNAYGNYNYRTAEGILRAVKAAMPDGAYLNLSDELVEFTSRSFLCARVQLHYGGEMLESRGYAELERHKGMSAEQCVGSASSYARKYALCGLFAVDDSKADPDAMDNSDNGRDSIRRMVEMCSTTEGLVKLWNSLADWQRDPAIQAMFTQRQEQINEQCQQLVK